ncbi:hypothetical protein [Mucisphaera calidilacus]|uniref:Uncharacterized protein n=1 Tax=Mucisphaera calidilacus TaxID=2527982 RepID=A0A518BTS9_9BACT|nr:hypothetical protein [Mucisphaera calidilacus]QDU70375.1 hypothetical protein Pan265_02010 [Mucisphaera calidilacus]
MTAPETADSGFLWQTARQIFLLWEVLRVPYNLVLAGLVGYFAWHYETVMHSFQMFPGHYVMCVIEANVLFMAGPVVHTYLCWLLKRRVLWIAVVPFVLGTLLAMVLAVAEIRPLFADSEF